MIIPKDYLIPIINKEIREGKTHFEVYEGWRKDVSLFKGDFSKGIMKVNSISKDQYKMLMPGDQEVPKYFDLIQKVLQASGIVDTDQITEFQQKFEEITQDEEPFRRNVRFYYDTNSFMNNYFYLFREMIPNFTKNATHNTSLGVVAEMEDIFDRKLKGRFFPDHFKKIYGKNDDIFFNQPNLFGRFARLAYPEIEYLKDRLRVNILTEDGVGDRRIMSAFTQDAQEHNIDGVIVTNDGTMSERAEMRMGSWLVRLDLHQIKNQKTNLEYFIESIYRAAIVYGKVQINNDIVVSGLWSRKKIDDWNEQNVLIDKCNDCDIGRIRNILKEIPEDFYGKGYYS